MESPTSFSLVEHFSQLPDPRVVGRTDHPLVSIVVIALCAVICGAEHWDDIEEFGEAKAAWFRTFLDLPHGIPRHDTFNRVFAALDPDQFRACFLAWVQAILPVVPDQVIALDGKTVRRSHDRPTKHKAIHMVTAWATANRLVLAQVKVAEKTNEITALPQVLRCLALRGCIVTIDAMGCQREIAQQILDQGGDYILALKGNQGTLRDDVEDTFTLAQPQDFALLRHTTATVVTKGHGRLETRQHWVSDDPTVLAWLQREHGWPGLVAIGMVQATRRVGRKKATTETRYYILSKRCTAEDFAAAVRSHWGIENSLHWVLDMSFHEDQSRIRAGYAAENFVVLRHLALNLLQSQPVKRLGIAARRRKAGWDHEYLLRVLTSA